MAIDTKYQDNVVLKQDAFQNLLTNIKNYPIIDIDYIAEGDVDELHGDYIWENYTSGIPCIKITYGDDRTTKGNVIFSEENRIAINNDKRYISQIQTKINELTKRKNRWNEVYNQNYAVFQNKTNQLARFKSNFDKIQNDKLSFLKAGWNLLYGGSNLNIDDPYSVVGVGASYNPQTVYYVHSNDYFFSRYEYSYQVDNNGTLITVTADVHDSITPDHDEYENMVADWTAKLARDEIYIKSNRDRGPVVLEELGPEYFSYTNILLNKNPYSLVPLDAIYSSDLIYYKRGTSSFVEYGGNGIASDDPLYESTVENWQLEVNARKLYTKEEEQNIVKTFNLEYSALNSARASMLSTLLVYRNNQKADGTPLFNQDQKQIFDDFIDFIYAYNKLVLLDTIGIAGYSQEDIDTLKEQYPSIEAILNGLDGEQLEDFNWNRNSSEYDLNWQGIAQTFKERIDDIINSINNVINTNLIYIRDQIRNINYSIAEYNEVIESYQNDIDTRQAEILEAASDRYDLVPTDATKINARDADYFIKDANEEFVHYSSDTNSDWQTLTSSGKMYLRNDRTMFGYKYVKVGSNISFDDTYFQNVVDNYSPGRGKTSEAFEVYNDASDQDSGTFRITINGHIYEIPIKGFSVEPSNQDVFITVDDNHLINFAGNVAGSGSVVINNGNLFMSSGAVIAATYEGLQGYSEGSDYATNVANFNSSDNIGNAHAGLWYDGSNNRLIRTWNISEDADNIGLGCYQLVLISGDANKGTDNGNRLGIIGNGNTIEFHTGLPSINNNTNNNLADIKVGNIISNGQDLGALGTSSDTTKFFRGDRTWSDTLTGTLTLSTEVSGRKHTDSTIPTTSNYLFRANGNGYFDGNLKANKVFNAVFNDYAECRQSTIIAPGYVVIDQDDGTMISSFERLQPGAQIVSDTYGNLMGMTETAKTPIAVAGRVLAYTYRPREEYHAGMAVCSAPGGTIDIMTREEIRDYPDCIIGIVSEIPSYDTWGTENIQVNGRIWIKVK